MSDKREKTNPWLALMLLWGVVAFFTLLGAGDVRDEVEWPWLQGALTVVAKAGDAVGLSHVRSGVEALRGRLNDDYLVLQEAVEPQVATTDESTLSDDTDRVAPAKHRVLVIGASSIQFALGVQLEHALAGYQGVKAKRFGKLATGLARPDYFDWPKKLEQLTESFKPDLVIANFGGNCAQDIPLEGYDKVQFESEAWEPLYAERVKALALIARKHGADFVFLGMPNMKDPKFAAKMERVNRVQRRAAEEVGALWFPTWAMSSNKDGTFKQSIHYQGDRGLMRALDGVHYRTLGARFIVDQILQEVERHFLFAPSDTTLARAEPHAFESKTLERKVAYVAFIPKTATRQNKRPVLYLLPGASSKWSRWPNYPHRSLQRLAAAHGIVLVVLDLPHPTAELFAQEIAPDIEAHLPVSDRRGLLGPELADLHVALDRRDVSHTFKEVPPTDFRTSLDALISWHAEQLSAPVTRR